MDKPDSKTEKLAAALAGEVLDWGKDAADYLRNRKGRGETEMPLGQRLKNQTRRMFRTFAGPAILIGTVMTGASAVQTVEDAGTAETRKQVPEDFKDTTSGVLKTLGLLYVWDKTKRKKAVEAPPPVVVEVAPAPAREHAPDPKIMN
jgi:hypothetical protein